MSSNSGTTEAKAIGLGDVVWFRTGEDGRPARGEVVKFRAGKPRVRLADDTEETVDPSRIVEPPAAPGVGETVWYRTANGGPASAVMAGEDENGWYRVTTGHGLTVPLNPGLVIDPPADAAKVSEPVAAAGEGVQLAPPERDALVINVPAGAVAHFWEEPPAGHEEFWAFGKRPDAEPGQGIEFLIRGELVAEAVVGRVEEPGRTKCEGTGKFGNQWKVFWPPESFRDLRPVLQWEVEGKGPDVKATGHGGAQFRIEDGEPTDDEVEVWHAGIVPAGQDLVTFEPDRFPTLAAAKAWCEERNRELAAAAAPVRTTETPKDERRAAAAAAEEPKPDRLQKHLADIEKAEREATNLRLEWEEAKDHAAALKKDYERACEDLCRIIRDYNAPAPLFDQVAGGVRMPTAQVVTVPPATGEAPGENGEAIIPPSDPDAWRAVPIGEVVTDEKLAALLAEHGITTFGELEDHRAARWEPKVAGLGEKKRQAVEDFIVAYWIAHPREKAAAGKPAGLAWEPEDGGNTWAADNTAGITEDEGEPSAFVIEDKGEGAGSGRYALDMSSDYLMPSKFPSGFELLDDAKAWCQRRNDELAADPDRGQPLSPAPEGEGEGEAEPAEEPEAAAV